MKVMFLIFKKKAFFVALKTVNVYFSEHKRHVRFLTSHSFVVDQKKNTLICKPLNNWMAFLKSLVIT